MFSKVLFGCKATILRGKERIPIAHWMLISPLSKCGACSVGFGAHNDEERHKWHASPYRWGNILVLLYPFPIAGPNSDYSFIHSLIFVLELKSPKFKVSSRLCSFWKLWGRICFLASSSFWRLPACLTRAPSSNPQCSIFRSTPAPTALSLFLTFGSLSIVRPSLQPPTFLPPS